LKTCREADVGMDGTETWLVSSLKGHFTMGMKERLLKPSKKGLTKHCHTI